MMVFSNHLQSLPAVPREPVANLLLLLSPFAPHLAEEGWQTLGHAESLAYEQWPEFDEALCEESTATLGVQVNGKVRAQLQLPKDADEALAKELALGLEPIVKWTKDKDLKKFIYVPGRIINIVAK